MPVKIPTFADLGFNDPQAATRAPVYPANDPGAEALGTLGKGLQTAGGAIADYAQDAELKRDKLNESTATLDLFTRLAPLNTKIAQETDTDKIAEYRAEINSLLQTSGNALAGNPARQKAWMVNHGKTILDANRDADTRTVKLYRDKSTAASNELLDRTVKTGASTDDPMAYQVALRGITDHLDWEEKNGNLLPTERYAKHKQLTKQLVEGRALYLLGKDKPDEALAFLDKERGVLDPITEGNFRLRIEAKAEKFGDEAYLNKKWGGSDKGYAGSRGGAGGDVERFLDMTEQHESGGRNIKQQVLGPNGGLNPSTGTVTGPSTAQGYFQITNTTWGEFAPAAGVDTEKYPNAMSAPYDVQRKVARTIATTSGTQHWTDYNKNLRAAVQAAGFPVSGPITGEGREAKQQAETGGPAPSEPAGPPVAIGDSIAAHLIRKAGVGGKEYNDVSKGDSTAVSGHGPAAVLGTIGKTPEANIKGRDVLLSTGVSNDPAQIDLVAEQIKALKARGARSVTVLGVGTAEKVKGANDALSQIAADNGAAFAGPMRKVSGDGIHSSDNKDLLQQAQAVRPAGGRGPDRLDADQNDAPAAGEPIPLDDRTIAAPVAPGGAPLRDIEAEIAEVQADADRGVITQKRANFVAAGMRSRFNHVLAAQANDRAVLTKRLNNGMAALADGRDFEYDPAIIRHHFPKEIAEDWLLKLEDTKEAGQITAGVRTSSPEELNRQQQQITAGLSDPNAPDYARRRKLTNAFNTAVDKHNKELGADPAAYVAMHNPTVAEKFTAATDATQPAATAPQRFADYATAALAEQGRLGLPEESRAILPKGVATAAAEKIAAIDPAKDNPGPALAAMAHSYGEHWPKVFGELVQAKLPSTYQVLAIMDRPEQIVAAGDLSRAIGLIAEKGGMSALKKSVPDTVQKEIDKRLDDALVDFRESTGPQAGGARLYATVRDAAQALAYYHGFRGKSESEAVQVAVDGIINAKYDFGRVGADQVRVPKGMLGTVERATEVVQAGINVDQLAEPRGNQLIPPEKRKETWLGAIRAGGWANNEDDSGLVLMGRFRDNAYHVVRRADGSRIEVKFDAAAAIAATAAPVLQVPSDQSGAGFIPQTGAPYMPAALVPRSVPIPAGIDAGRVSEDFR